MVAGLLTMAAPFVIDATVMLPLGLLLQLSFSANGTFALALAGAGFLGWMGLQSIRAGAKKSRIALDTLATDASEEKKELPSFLKGVLTHLTSPFPYLYWGTVGSSFIREGFERGGAWGATIFPLGFWSGALTFTLLVIWLLARGKRLLPPHLEPYLHRISGLLLIASGVLLAVSARRGLF